MRTSVTPGPGPQAALPVRRKLRSRPTFIGITKFLADHMVVEVNAKTEPHSRWSVARELRLRAKLALDKADIELPKGLTLQIEQA